MIMHFKRQWSVYLWYLIILIGLVITILPFWWGVAASFKSNSEIFRDLAPISYKAFLPGFSLDSYFAIFENDFGRSMLNTFFVSITSVAGGLLINEKYNLGGNNIGEHPKKL